MQQLQGTNPPELKERLSAGLEQALMGDFSMMSGILALQFLLQSNTPEDRRKEVAEQIVDFWVFVARPKMSQHLETQFAVLMAGENPSISQKDLKQSLEEGLEKCREIILESLLEEPGFLTS